MVLTSPPPDPGGLVLVVDDIAENRELLRRRLESQGHMVIEAADGAQAFEALGCAPVDVILLDILMPGMDGYEVLERLKAHSDWSRIPVIVISSLDQMDSVVRCVELGASDYLHKPFNRVLLRARVSTCLEQKRLRDREQWQYRALEESQARLRAELAEAAAYVRSLLPTPLRGEVRADWEYIPSTSLGGDALGYHTLDADQLAIYLLDVCGHGVGAALLVGGPRLAGIEERGLARPNLLAGDKDLETLVAVRLHREDGAVAAHSRVILDVDVDVLRLGVALIEERAAVHEAGLRMARRAEARRPRHR